MLNGIILSYPTFQYIRSTFSVFKLALRKAKDKHGWVLTPHQALWEMLYIHTLI